jgi:hypothetical protein
VLDIYDKVDFRAVWNRQWKYGQLYILKEIQHYEYYYTNTSSFLFELSSFLKALFLFEVNLIWIRADVRLLLLSGNSVFVIIQAIEIQKTE